MSRKSAAANVSQADRLQIRSTAEQLVRHATPSRTLADFLGQCSERGLHELADRVCRQLDQRIDPTDVVAVLLQHERI